MSDDRPDDPAGPEPEGEAAPRGVILATNALVLYSIMIGIAGVASWFILDRLPLKAEGSAGVPDPWKVGLGIGVGLGVFVVDQGLERLVPAFKRMSEAFKDLLGGMTGVQVMILAVASSVGEEIFFRGFLQSWVGLVGASILFGLLHIAPDRRLWMWPLLAIGMGFAFGWLFEYTGDVLAPMLAHFTINYFSLMVLSRRSAAASDAAP